MKQHVIIGTGVAGSHHLRVLRANNRPVSKILDAKQPGFVNAWLEALTEEHADTIWHICTPTETHLSYLKTILSRNKYAKIILEKPIGNPGEWKEFVSLIDNASVVIQSQYSYSLVVKLFCQILRNLRKNGELNIKICFAKLRSNSDRFQDNHRLALGYEGFHQFALFVRLVEAVVEVGDNSMHGDNVDIVDAYHDESRHSVKLSRGNIKGTLVSRLDWPSRLNIIEVSDSDGNDCRLTFETSEWFTGSARQTHLISLNGRALIFEEDLISTGVETVIACLEHDNHAEMRKNQQRAVYIEKLLDRSCIKANRGIGFNAGREETCNVRRTQRSQLHRD